MEFFFLRMARAIFVLLLISAAAFGQAQTSPPSSSSKHSKASLPHPKSELDPGLVLSGIYRNRVLALSCKIPAGWVLRTDEMNARDEEPAGSANDGRVLLAAFSRPPDARGDEVNSSIMIAAEPQSSYPGLKDAAQYFGPLTEVAQAQGFTVDEEPYEFAVGAKNVVRSDFHKDIGSRVMRQSTLAFLAQGYAVSITLIAGTEEELEQLIDSLSFSAAVK